MKEGIKQVKEPILFTWYFQSLGVSLGVLPTALLAIPFGIIFMILYMLLIDKFVFKYYRHQKSPPVQFAMVSIGVMFVTQAVVRIIIGPGDRRFFDGEKFIIKAREFKEMTGNVPLVDSAIKKSELGLNPQIDGQLVRLPIPELNEERRTELKKMIKSMGEKCKVSIRNIRREANEELKKLLKSKEISEDEEKSNEKNIQTITDNHIKVVDEKVSSKEKEIMTI